MVGYLAADASHRCFAGAEDEICGALERTGIEKGEPEVSIRPGKLGRVYDGVR